jgi:hypothetical protein
MHSVPVALFAALRHRDNPRQAGEPSQAFQPNAAALW